MNKLAALVQKCTILSSSWWIPRRRNTKDMTWAWLVLVVYWLTRRTSKPKMWGSKKIVFSSYSIYTHRTHLIYFHDMTWTSCSANYPLPVSAFPILNLGDFLFKSLLPFSIILHHLIHWVTSYDKIVCIKQLQISISDFLSQNLSNKFSNIYIIFIQW